MPIGMGQGVQWRECSAAHLEMGGFSMPMSAQGRMVECLAPAQIRAKLRFFKFQRGGNRDRHECAVPGLYDSFQAQAANLLQSRSIVARTGSINTDYRFLHSRSGRCKVLDTGFESLAKYQ